MKRLLPLLLCIVAFGCKKDAPPQRQFMQFTIDGIPDTVTIEQIDTVEIPFTVTYASGEAERIALNIEGLPASVGAHFAASIDTPTFASSLRLVSVNAGLGIYDISVSGSYGNTTVTETFKLKVVPNLVNPAAVLTGTYNELGPCTVTGALNNTVTITEDLPSFNKIKITKLWNDHPTTIIYADVDPENQTITIPPQEVNSATFSGEGTYTSSQINVNYSVVTTLWKDSCTVVWSK